MTEAQRDAELTQLNGKLYTVAKAQFDMKCPPVANGAGGFGCAVAALGGRDQEVSPHLPGAPKPSVYPIESERRRSMVSLPHGRTIVLGLTIKSQLGELS